MIYKFYDSNLGEEFYICGGLDTDLDIGIAGLTRDIKKATHHYEFVEEFKAGYFQQFNVAPTITGY